ncbi:PilN domain-containing protein [Herbaspirillum sp. ST 5-3]|uniref:PilN domain-containing protein n=1 Tax=Oxalobacteraceae TaxID=75682 RepID=UPI0010A32972|nr:PilN domain-containing protein [Herbaspirillum sp. ST 5-3]
MSQQINLFNPIFLKQKKYFSAVTMAQALGLILAGCALLAGYAQYQVTAYGKEAAATTAQLAATQAELGKVNATYGPRQKSKSLEDELHQAEAEVSALQHVFDTLQQGDFGNTKGYADYLRAFAREIVNGVWLTGFTIEGAGNEIELRGRALQPELVPAYITRLKREPVLQGKSFAALEMRTPASDQGATDSAGHIPKPAAPAYIEFSLRSSGMMKDRAEASGAKNK